MEEKNISKLQFEFSEEEINLILTALSKEPYVQVFELIANIHNQYSMMLNQNDK